MLQCEGRVSPNPMDAKTIGELAAEHQAKMLISTPTFCASYLRRCTREQFGHLKYAIVGAEKLRPQLAAAFREHFGVDLLEGYGCTEMSPVVSVNLPNIEHLREKQIGTKPGSVGHPIPGVAARVVDQETGQGPMFDREGLLLVKGPNMMAGYLGQPEKTAEVLRDGWYVTGDIATMDEDGFIFITDRLSRFSKLGGEMVPHVKIEEAINDAFGESCSAVHRGFRIRREARLVVSTRAPTSLPRRSVGISQDRAAASSGCPARENIITWRRSRRSEQARSICGACASSRSSEPRLGVAANRERRTLC